MNYGLYVSAAGALSNINRQDVITNNLVNVETIGFKPDMVIFRQRLPERVSSGAPIEPQLLLERLGGSPTLNPTHVNLTQGSLLQTGNELDVAIEGDGFFVVKGADGQMRLTRDGRFAMDTDGKLITADSGLEVLDASNRAIRLNSQGRVEIDGNGHVWQNGSMTAKIRIATPRDPAALVKLGNNLLRDPNLEQSTALSDTTRVVQGTLESSAVNAISTLRDLVGAAKAVQSNVKMMQYQDHIMGQAINTMARVS